MRLSILDQSPIISGHDARRALEETLALARRADELGYYRYWLAEHHAIAALADPCPEVLVARLGAETRRMRVGTGGVLLPYYSAFRVAEAFRMLEALYPGRIDLGIGRAPGGDARTAQAVAGGGFPDASHFPQQVLELIGHLDGTLDAAHPFKRVRVQPEVPTAPEVWLLGSSDYSGALALRHDIAALLGAVAVRRRLGIRRHGRVDAEGHVQAAQIDRRREALGVLVGVCADQERANHRARQPGQDTRLRRRSTADLAHRAQRDSRRARSQG